ncbi:reverse transcriptase (RNA-dependent DNA polymerase) [Hirsutella rhossiliensis]|uniref:Reverse transcriptase (RNA-dependent DNA polymerase) domain-containing protein n=1 Tax=Hirsutella rhossiliensis TaxID=111463 RepID=A0A9P8SGN1_9HYPO|nr:reverse transcriptase (RNA-dependent DNA polymerase) domain-containing protein [Hirsutella rhossiliensis]KAH0961966.1 reverse transcriptase (RNA-dependent DNA polymerase) domain-containing protein [Hirsutella rhossiliensis]
MAFITMDIDGRAERLYGYVIPGLEFDLILGKGWAERNDVVYKAGKRLQIGRGNSRVKVPRRPNPTRDQRCSWRFPDDDDVDITPPHRDIWDHAINLEKDDDGRDKRPPFGPLYEISPASAPVLFARKPSGGLRFCVDYRGLNAITKNDRYPLPLIRETLRNLATARWFTKLDVRAAFHRLRVRHGDEWKTAFRTRYGQFEWLVTPFGLTGAPATFQRYINSHLHDLLDEFCSAYMDDVIIYSDGDYLDHMTKVRTVMERLRNAGLKLDLEKCAFAVKEVKYLGFIIKAGEGVTVDPEKIQAIRDWEAPTTVTGVRSFLGFANFYREFIETFAAVSEPLNNLTKKLTKWNWDASAQNAFNKLRNSSSPHPSSRCFTPTARLLRPVGYFSRKFSAAEVNYDIHDKELLAIVAAMEHFSGELRSVDKFIVVSDHKNLQYFATNRRLSERQVRLAETLSRYTFKIVFRAGKDNTQPDFSRRAQDLPANGDDERLKNREFQLLKDHWLPPRTVKHHQGDYILNQLVSAVQTRRSKTTPIDDSQAPPRGAKLFFDSALQLLWDRGLIEDGEYRNIHASVVQGNATFPSEYNLSVQVPDCEIDDRGALLRRGALWTHDSHITGHPGRDVTLNILQRSYFWPQQYLMPTGSPTTFAYSDRFHSELSVDFMVDLPANGKGPRFLMCHYRFHGFPKTMTSDRGSNWVSKFWQRLCELPLFLTHGYHAEPIQQNQISSRSKTDPKARADHFIARLREVKN